MISIADYQMAIYNKKNWLKYRESAHHRNIYWIVFVREIFLIYVFRIVIHWILQFWYASQSKFLHPIAKSNAHRFLKIPRCDN